MACSVSRTHGVAAPALSNPDLAPHARAKARGEEATASFDSQEGSGISFGYHKTIVGVDGMTACTKCDGTGASINRPHSSMGNK